MNRTVLPVLLALSLAACTASRPPLQIAKPEPVPDEKTRKSYLKPRDVQRVRTGEFVKTYHVGRSVAGRNGSTMREAHRVYRIERPSRWNLLRDQPPLASTGPVNKVVDSAFKPAPRSEVIQAELNHQQTMTAELEQARDELVDAVGDVRSQLAKSAENAERIKPLRDENRFLREEVERLKRSQSVAMPLPEPPAGKPGDALKVWGEKLDSKEK